MKMTSSAKPGPRIIILGILLLLFPQLAISTEVSNPDNPKRGEWDFKLDAGRKIRGCLDFASKQSQRRGFFQIEMMVYLFPF